MSVARILDYESSVLGKDGRAYHATAVGFDRDDGLWDGYLEFSEDGGADLVRTARETTQPNLTDLEYWATGVSRVYLEGALERALELREGATSSSS